MQIGMNKPGTGKTIYRRRFLKTSLWMAAGHLLASHTPSLLAQQTSQNTSGIAWRNWSGLHQCQARTLAMPDNETAIAALLRNSSGIVRCVGSGHSFTPLVPTEDTLLSLDKLSGVIVHDPSALTVTLHAGTRLNQLSRQLDAFGFGLRNLPDIDVQTLAGAISTGTHGTGAALPALHADVIAMRIVTPQGEIVECNAQRHADIFSAARVSLGSIGVIAQLTMHVVPAYNLHRKVWLKPLDELLQRAPELALMHRHFEFYYLPFTGYAAAIAHDVHAGNDVLIPEPQDEEMLRDLRRLRDWFEKFPQLRRWVAQKMIDPDLFEEAKNRSWKLLSTSRPTKFNEAEYHVPRNAGIACLREIIRVLEKRNDVYFPVEFRFVKADDAWLSPFYQRDSCSIAVHAAHGEDHDYLLSEIGPVFRKYEGRPHWGKLHRFSTKELAALYPRWNDFQAVRRRMDPQGRMLNPYLRTLFEST